MHRADGKILYEVKDRVAYIVINRPEKRNAMTLEMWKSFHDFTRKACTSTDVDVVVYRGRGGAFSAGDDIGDMYRIQSPEEAKAFFEELKRTFLDVANCPKVTIGVVEGPAVGGGGELLLVLDYVLATKTAYTGFPEIHIGLIPPLLATLGPYILGMKKAKKLAISGVFLNAEEALSLGIFDEVIDPDKIEEKLEELISAVKLLPRDAIASIKKLVMASVHPALEAGINELELLVLSNAAKERMREFLEKKRPRPS